MVKDDSLFGYGFNTSLFANKSKNESPKVETPKKEEAKEFAKNYGDRFKSNMADYFDKTESPFDFSGTSEPGDISIGNKVDAFTAQIFPNFVKDYGPQQEPIGIAGTPGQKGFFSQIAGPIAGAAAKAFFPV